MTGSALVIGSAGQDGRLLIDLLTSQGRSVIACSRNIISGSELFSERPRLEDPMWVATLIGETRPEHVYYLAAVHHSSEDRASNDVTAFASMYAANTQGLANVLEAIRTCSPTTRIFYAASSHIFGNPTVCPQDEKTSVQPTTLYGISKAAGFFYCRYYRNVHGLFAVTGILYNHESILRGPQFLSAKITRAVAEIKVGLRQELILGSLDAVVDWGYAPDYVRAMQAMLEQSTADDFVVATGAAHTVRDFAEIAFASVGLDYRIYVRSDASLLQRDHGVMVGNPARLQSATGWSPSIEFDAMIRQLVAHQLTIVTPSISKNQIVQ